MPTREEMLKAVRDRMAEREGTKKYVADPFEFKAPKVEGLNDKKTYKFVVLPPLEVGEKCASGTNATDCSGLWYYKAGTHWISNRPYECPRVHDGEPCPYCKVGFELYDEADDQALKQEVRKAYFPQNVFAVNIYFPEYESNPAELRGKVMWFKMKKTVFDKMQACLQLDESAAVGDTPDENQPFGFFYLPEESYVFQLVITHKGGFNDYSQSKFLLATKGPIVKDKAGQLDQEKLNKLLAQRHDLGAKFSKRKVDELQKLIESTLNGGTAAAEHESGFSETEEVKQPAKAAVTTKVAPKVESAHVDVDKLVAETATTAPKATVKKTTAIPDSDEDLDQLLSSLNEETN